MYLIRHGESQFNLHFSSTGRDPGIIDAPLTPRGVEQAKAAARHFLKLKNTSGTRAFGTARHGNSGTEPAAGQAPARIFSSPYTRAIQTALPIADALNLPLRVLPLLGERRLYSCDTGTPCAGLKSRFPQVDFSPVEKEDWWPAAHEGEADIARRVAAFSALEDAAREHAEGEALVVSHWYFIFTLSSLDCDNCQIVWRDPGNRFHRH